MRSVKVEISLQVPKDLPRLKGLSSAESLECIIEDWLERGVFIRPDGPHLPWGIQYEGFTVKSE